MSRKKAPFKEYEGSKIKDKHIRLTADMMMSKAYLELSDSAKTVYNYMKLYACGKSEFEYPIALALKYTSKPTFIKARDELIREGFIEFVHHNRVTKIKNVYKFSAKWQANKRPIPHGNI